MTQDQHPAFPAALSMRRSPYVLSVRLNRLLAIDIRADLAGIVSRGDDTLRLRATFPGLDRASSPRAAPG